MAREGWKGLTNGALLRRASESGFAALVTADANMEHQQDLTNVALRIVLVPVQTMPRLRPLVPNILAGLASAAPGQVTRI